MAMYDISSTPLINRLTNKSVKQALYADDASAAGNIHVLRDWWDLLIRVGPDYGYYPSAPITSMIVKEEIFSLGLAEAIFVTKEGKRHLGAAIIGTEAFNEAYV